MQTQSAHSITTKVILLFLIFLLKLNIYAQNIDETIILADKMFSKKEYSTTIELLKRVIFFSEIKQSEVFEKCGDAYFMQNDYKNALNLYDSAFVYSSTKQNIQELIYKKIDCLIFSGKYNDAELMILTSEETNISEEIKRKNFYLGIIYYAQTNYEKSKEFFINSLNDTAIMAKSEVSELFKKKKYFERPNPKIAGIFSLIVPGSGQLYAGDYKNAINSFLLVAVFAAIGTDMLIRYAWYDSLISVSPWFLRYYTGGYKNAVDIARQKRTERRNKRLNEIIEITRK
ncbi:MAG: hypothetical protein L3J35_09910 [Bacteroidales bacterium]|nr:hypothetical protein [Bacteroidales bacterium]